MTPRLEILPTHQLELYPHLKQITELDFVLFGGTAIALQLGHRQSIDFDFFTSKEINAMKSKLSQLPNLESHNILQTEENTLVFETKSQVKFSFFGNIEFANISNSIASNDRILNIANLDTLLATKLKVICNRAEYKDYRDIAEILKTKSSSLDKGLKLLKEFFGDEIPKAQILKSLTYFNDGDLHKLNKQDRKILEDSVIAYNKKLLNPS